MFRHYDWNSEPWYSVFSVSEVAQYMNEQTTEQFFSDIIPVEEMLPF